MKYNSLKRIPEGGLASFLTSNMDEIEDNVLAFGAPRGINSMVEVGNRMASYGRNGDDQLVHMKTGEIAVSPEILKENPKLAKELTQAFDRSNVDMERYTVGSGANSINPVTGQPEFFLKKLIKGIKNVFKKIAPIIIPIGLNMLLPGLGAVGSGALGAGITTLVQGGNFKDALKNAAFGALAGGFTAGIQTGFGEGFTQAAFGTPGQRLAVNPKVKEFVTGKAPAATPIKTAVTAQQQAAPASTPAAATPSPAAKPQNFFEKYLSPNRGVASPAEQLNQVASIVDKNPNLVETLGKDAVVKMAQDQVAQAQPGLLARYGPLAAVGTGLAAAAGAFETPEVNLDDSPFGITSQELYAQNPEKYSVFARMPFGTTLGRKRRQPKQEDYIFQSYLPQYAAQGGEMYPRRQGYIAGPGTETSDDIPAMLSDGEFVMTARAVRGAGNGSREKGVRKMYDMMRAFEGGAVA